MKHAALLPEGSELIGSDEAVLWQGRPSIAGLATRRLHVRALMGYFAVLAAWNLAQSYRDGFDPRLALLHTSWIALAALAIALLVYAAAALIAVTTRYTITGHRLILQIGILMPIALTLPLKRIASAELRLHPDGSGDIPLTLDDAKLAYLLIWPHARPWHMKAPQPMLLGVPEAREVAAVLSSALLQVLPGGVVAAQTITQAPRSAPSRAEGRPLIGSPAS